MFVCFFDVVVSVLRGFIPFKVQGNYLFSFHLTSSNTVYSLHTGTVGGCVETWQWETPEGVRWDGGVCVCGCVRDRSKDLYYLWVLRQLQFPVRLDHLFGWRIPFTLEGDRTRHWRKRGFRTKGIDKFKSLFYLLCSYQGRDLIPKNLKQN